MKVFTIVSAAIFVLLCPIIRLAVCREQPMGEPKIANWQNANSRLAHEWLVDCFTGTVIENSFILFSYRHPAKYSSLFTKSPESPVFIGIPRGEEYSGTLHLLFTLQFWLICNPSICLSHLFPCLKVKSGEEWVKR